MIRSTRPGALCLGLGVTCLLFSVLSGTGAAALSAWSRLSLAATGAVALAASARLQSSRAHPLVPLSLFARAETAAPYLCGALLGTTIFGVDTFVPLFVQGARGGTAAAAGAVVTPLMLFWALSSSVAARLIVPLGFRTTARVGALFIVAGFTGSSPARVSTPPWPDQRGLRGGRVGPRIHGPEPGPRRPARDRGEHSRRGLEPRAVLPDGGRVLGVGALGALLSFGLLGRLGAAATETAGRLLAGRGPRSGVGLDPLLLRQALEHALLPVFAVLLGLALLSLFVAGFFPARADKKEPPVPSGPTREAAGTG